MNAFDSDWRCFLVLWLTLAGVGPAWAGSPPPVQFNRDIRPILSSRCLRCHGPDASSREAGLRLDLEERAKAVLESGQTAIVPGKPEASELVARIGSVDGDVRMPPPHAGDPLSEPEKELVWRWIEQGAPYERHWSFTPPVRPAAPSVSNPAWIRNPIDSFVMGRWDREGLGPSREADPYVLVRRVCLDLTGLPPDPHLVDRFIGDRNEGAYENIVDRLLDSPAYGERWARPWLDLARYADSAGYAQDPPRSIWRYRDWVIQAINANLPFDQFTIQQLAGDMLPSSTEEQLIATAFHRNTMTNSEGGTDDEEFRCAAVVDRVNTTMQDWMGLTFGCAQCHDHKYDPVTQQEYYRLFAVFNTSEDADQGDERPFLQIWSDEERQRRELLAAQIKELEQVVAHEAASSPNSGSPTSKTPASQQLEELKKQLEEIRGVTTPVMRELSADKRRETHIHIRGNFLVKGESVSPGVPAAFHSLATQGEPNRLALAMWLVDPSNPLTARVAANRLGAQIFGTGLVETSEDFGSQGSLPSHHDLLDYLAA